MVRINNPENIWCAYLLRRDVVRLRPHVDLLVVVHAGDDEEHARAPRPALQQPPQPEDDGPLVLLRMRCRDHDVTIGAMNGPDLLGMSILFYFRMRTIVNSLNATLSLQCARDFELARPNLIIIYL